MQSKRYKSRQRQARGVAEDRWDRSDRSSIRWGDYLRVRRSGKYVYQRLGDLSPLSPLSLPTGYFTSHSKEQTI
jgi:hypothetical protein